MREFDREPIPGLPETLPDGERILWQGAPRWPVLARRAFHLRKVVVWFGLIVVWLGVMDAAAGQPLAHTLLIGGWLALLTVAAAGLLALLAWAMARATLYTITNQRVVMRFGVAIPLTINLPFRQIASAALRAYPDGSGDIPLTLQGGERVSYLVLWPHVRPWHFAPVQPMLRAVPDAARVARILSEAVSEAATRAGASLPAANDPYGGRPAARPAPAAPSA